jgi:negative regulator of sigma E activity
VNTACETSQANSKGYLPFFLLSLAALATPTTDVRTIIERSVIASQNDRNAAPEYTYFERVQTGKKGSKTYHDLMIDGSPYEELVSIDGKSLPPDMQQAEQLKLESVIRQRRGESEQQRTERIARYESDRRRDSLMMEQLTKAFDFRLLGAQNLDGFSVYVLKATPRPGYRPPNAETEALRGMQSEP